jgi:AcrR family transcriptional regulator
MTLSEPQARPRHTSPETLERGRRRRAEILAVATEMFAAEGYRGTGLAGIAARAGVTQAGLLHHFGSKERLLEAVVRRRDEQDAWLLDAMVGEGGLAFIDRLPLLAQHNEGRPGLAQLYTVLVAENLGPEHPAHDYFVLRYRFLRNAFAEAIREGQTRGEVRADVDAGAVATRILATMDGLQTQWLLDPDQTSLLEVFQEYSRALRRELTAVT